MWGRVRNRPTRTSRELATMAVIGVGAGSAFGWLVSPALGVLVGWDAAALAYLVWVWVRIWPMDAEATARLAVREDPGRGPRELLLLVAGLASLLAVAFVLARTRSLQAPTELLHVAVGLLSVLVSWAVVHTVFTARYARLYYTGADGGINFNQTSPPRYTDFAYVAVTVAVTFQVSDTNLTSGEMRTTVLRHALLSYLFGAIIIAITINLLAGLVR